MLGIAGCDVGVDSQGEREQCGSRALLIKARSEVRDANCYVRQCLIVRKEHRHKCYQDESCPE